MTNNFGVLVVPRSKRSFDAIATHSSFIAHVTFAENAWCEFRRRCLIRGPVSALLCATKPAASVHWERETVIISSSLDNSLGCTPEQCNRKAFLFEALGFSVVRDTGKNADDTTPIAAGPVAPSLELSKKRHIGETDSVASNSRWLRRWPYPSYLTPCSGYVHHFVAQISFRLFMYPT